MNEESYAVILNQDGEALLKKIDKVQYANELPYVLSKGFSVPDHHFAQIQLHQPDGTWSRIQIPLHYVLGTVYLAGNKRVSGFGAN